ncbi:hypothetical protein [Defluviitalea phaphyphila]|uniref:hypothetical protein n=1 Tax=Defluviitalea phaphyphila TaxID=1473580 RepID=UPI0007317C66|nr:hypothetical protein [Defluviitalea phaphyphila]
MRISFKSLVIGLGIGIIVTSLFVMIFTLKLKNEKETTLLTNEEIIQKAKELGMINPLDLEADKFVLSNEEIINKARKLGMEYTSTVDLQVYKEQEGQVDIEEFVTVFIPKGINSEEMAIIFYKNGLIDSVEEFNSYLKNQNLTTINNGGYFDIPKNSDYEELINIITK